MRILVVDDQDQSRRKIRDVLSTHADLLVCGEAADGREAIEKAMAVRPDLILMDASMPGLDGLEAALVLRRRLPESRIIIILSPHDEKDFDSRIRLLHVDGF